MTQHPQGDSAQISTFQFEQLPVRTVYEDGQAWFVGRDVAEALGYKDTVNAIKLHCKGVVKHHPLQTPGGMQDVRIINEPDMFRLIVNSHLPAAERFERWVFEDVLPTLRKTGSYTLGDREGITTKMRRIELTMKLIDRLRIEKRPELRAIHYANLVSVMGDQSHTLPPLSDIGSEEPGTSSVTSDFWRAFNELEKAGHKLNHSRRTDLVAISLNEVLAAAHKWDVWMPARPTLSKVLQSSRVPAYVGNRVVNSGLAGKTVRCFVFKRKPGDDGRNGVAFDDPVMAQSIMEAGATAQGGQP